MFFRVPTASLPFARRQPAHPPGTGLRTVLALLLALYLAPAAAQNVPPASLDSMLLSDTIQRLEEIQRGPRNALLWSIIPGGGQAYNKRFWKVPLVYGSFLGMVAYADFSQTRYRRFVEALEARCLGDGNVIEIPNRTCIPGPDLFPGRSNEAIRLARDNQDRARQTAYIGIFLVYVLQAVEAYTDAHLQEFDISDDISLRLGPVSQPGQHLAYGLSLPLGANRNFHRQRARVAALQAGR